VYLPHLEQNVIDRRNHQRLHDEEQKAVAGCITS
jgi:hypothetical protein